jgi:PAS domain S-box-containing protein
MTSKNEAAIEVVTAPAARASALQSEALFRRLVDSVRDYAIFMLDAGGRVATWNAGAERIGGYVTDEIVGGSVALFYPADDAAAGTWQRELAAAAREGRLEVEGWRVRKDGSRFWANVVLGAVRDEAGDLLGFSNVMRDLTEQKRVEEEQAARLAAEQANRAKDEFLAMLGHELRNPLAPIVTALQLIKLHGDGHLSKEEQVIERQVKHMMHLVEDMLDISRISTGKIELRRHRIDLRDVVSKALEIASPLVEQRRHHLHLELPSRPLAIEADEARLTQVVANLVMNAAKYSNDGSYIAVDLRQEDGELVIEVRDTGIGIEPALLPNVFDLFVQGRQGVDRSAGGLGIGLTLVRTLVELHGGRVTADSPGIGRGSTFTVRLPAEEADATVSRRRSAPMAVASAYEPRRILVVDDNEDALELLAEVLSMAGHEVETAADAAIALQVMKRFKPEVAIIDIGLPVMDGYELAARIKSELTDTAPHMFALTGYGLKNDRARSLAAGFAAHFVKPVEVQRLLDSVASVAG